MRPYLYLLTLILLAACATNQPVDETIPVPIKQEAMVTSQPTVVATIATPPPTLSPTFLPTNTPEPSPTPTPISPPTGRIYFLWDSQPSPISGLGNPVQNMYLATPVEGTTIWTINTVLEGLVGWPAAVLSPDKTQMLLTPLEDRNQDGFVSDAGYDRGFDAPNLYIFDLINQVLFPITTNFPEIRERDIYWLPDGQTFLLGQYHTISLVSQVDQLRQIGPPFSEYIDRTNLSPDAQRIIINFVSGELLGLDVATGEVLFTFEGIGGFGLESIWSPDSKWIALHRAPGPEISFIDGENYTLNSVNMEGSIGLMAWSPTKADLALYWYTDTLSRLLLFDPENQTYKPIMVLPADTTLSYLGWSPDGTQLVYLLKQETAGSLYVVDLSGGDPQRIWQNETVGRFYFACWSPDGEWILFFAGHGSIYTTHDPSDIAAVYIVHRSGGFVYELHETTGFRDPYGFFWLP